MTDVLLIYPPIGPARYYTSEDLSAEDLHEKSRLTRVPQSSLSLATYLGNHDYSSKVFDCRLYGNDFWDKLKQEIEHTNLLIGVTVLTSQIYIILDILSFIKNITDTPVVLGGVHPTLYPEQTCDSSLVDYVIAGDGEVPLLQLSNALSENKNNFDKIKNLVYKNKSNSIRFNGIGTPFDIKTIGMPNYELLDFEKYAVKHPFFNGEQEIRGIDYNSSRHCPFACSFCINSASKDFRRFRYKPTEMVIDELSVLKDKYHFEYVFFEEENPFCVAYRLKEFANGMSKVGVQFYGNIGVRTILRSDRKDLEKLRESGWVETAVGVESGSDKIHKYLGKNITVNDIIKATRILHELNIHTLWSYMINLPHETNADRLKTFDLMKKISDIHPFSINIPPQSYRPYPGSKLYNDIKQLLKEPKVFEEWEMFVYEGGDPFDRPWMET